VSVPTRRMRSTQGRSQWDLHKTEDVATG